VPPRKVAVDDDELRRILGELVEYRRERDGIAVDVSDDCDARDGSRVDDRDCRCSVAVRLRAADAGSSSRSVNEGAG
jgi:hypothetical protein